MSYREIKDKQGLNVIGYELSEGQFLSSGDSDIVIYNSFRKDENSEFLPVLNVCSEAFTFSQVNSITFKDRSVDDDSAPEFSHKLNVRSNAFLAFLGNEVSFEVGVTFNHPVDLQGETVSSYDGSSIIGNSKEQAVKVFAESTVKSVTLPSDINYIPDKMFYNCAYLENIKRFGANYTGENSLYNIASIGEEAFSSCANIKNITVTSDTVEVGSDAFFAWGTGGNVQKINIDFYEGALPVGWAENWFSGDASKAIINYKSLKYITIDMQNGSELIEIGVKPGLSMPALEMPERRGYSFKGIYSNINGNGYQYYTGDLQISRIWCEGEEETLYADWEIVTYNIIYPEELRNTPNDNPVKYNVEQEVVLVPLEDASYIYNLIPDVIPKGTTGDIFMRYEKTPKEFSINYEVDLKGCINTNVTTYSVNDEIVFANLERVGYSFTWYPASISAGSTGDITVKGVWTPNQHNITYIVKEGTENPNPVSFNYEQEVILMQAKYGGYFVEWDVVKIPKFTDNDVTVTATYIEKTLDQCFSNGIYEIWTSNQFIQLHSQPNGGYGRSYSLHANISLSLMNDYTWEPISVFRGYINGNGYNVTHFSIKNSSNANCGLFSINYGTIENLILGGRFKVGNEFENITIGLFAGVNYGRISDCKIQSYYVTPVFTCYVADESYAGCYVGYNKGIIENCSGTGGSLYGKCNMGYVAGKNDGTISGCSVGGEIQYEYKDYNACVGGVVGLQITGSVTNCHVSGRIYITNYSSEKYNTISADREFQPCIGIVIGYRQGGNSSGNTWTVDNWVPSFVYSAQGFYTVTWTEGALWWQQTYTHVQDLYVKSEECGRTD